MGSPAVEPLMEYLETDCDTMQGDLLVETLGEVVVREEGEGRLSAETVRAAIDFCMRFFERAEQTRGGFTQALARMCGYAGAGAERFGPMLEVMTDRLWKAPYSYAMLGALGTAAGSSNCPAGTRVDLCSRFTNILKMEAPKEIGRRRQTDTGTVYEFGREIDFDTVVIPAAVRGLESLCTADGSSDSLRENIIKTLLNLWEGVAKVRVVWSPAAIDALVRAMSRAATCEHVAPRARLVLGSSLLRFAYQKLSVVRALGEVASQRVEDARMARFCLEVGEHLLQEHEKLEARDDERREALLVSMARIAANGSLDAVGRQPEPDAGESDKTFGRRLEELRNRAVQACFRALREGCLFSRAPLEMLGECESLRADLRREIADRINKAFALVRPGRCRPSF